MEGEVPTIVRVVDVSILQRAWIDDYVAGLGVYVGEDLVAEL